LGLRRLSWSKPAQARVDLATTPRAAAPLPNGASRDLYRQDAQRQRRGVLQDVRLAARRP